MRQFLTLLFGFVIFLSFLGSTEMIEFCDDFADNNYTISYGFRRRGPKNPYLKYIFIESNYWELNFNDNSAEVTFVSNDSKTAENWFGSGYSMAFCVKTTTYLLHKSYKYWESGILEDNPNHLIISRQKNRINVAKALEEGTIGFVPAHDETTLVLFKQRGPDYDVYKVNDTKKEPIHYMFKTEDQNVYSKYQSLKSLSLNVGIVAMFGQFRAPLNAASDKTGRGFIILFTVETSLKYCWTLGKSLSQDCNPGNLKLLIDCSKRLTPTEETDTELVIIIIIVTIIIIVIIVIIIVIVVYIGKTTKKAPISQSTTETSFKTLETPKRKVNFFKSSKAKSMKGKEEISKGVVTSKTIKTKRSPSESFRPNLTKTNVSLSDKN